MILLYMLYIIYFYSYGVLIYDYVLFDNFMGEKLRNFINIEYIKKIVDIWSLL